jgi:hypothetical protein
MCYGAENTHVFDSGGHDWKRHGTWDKLFVCRKCKLTAHGHKHQGSKPYACDLIAPDGWDGPLSCAALSDRLLVAQVMKE